MPNTLYLINALISFWSGLSHIRESPYKDSTAYSNSIILHKKRRNTPDVVFREK